jgi:hypothetical protein
MWLERRHCRMTKCDPEAALGSFKALNRADSGFRGWSGSTAVGTASQSALTPLLATA